MGKELFSATLGIAEPVFIDEVVIGTAEDELHIHLDFQRGGTYRCMIRWIRYGGI
jgi:hypothetical protein